MLNNVNTTNTYKTKPYTLRPKIFTKKLNNNYHHQNLPKKNFFLGNKKNLYGQKQTKSRNKNTQVFKYGGSYLHNKTYGSTTRLRLFRKLNTLNLFKERRNLQNEYHTGNKTKLNRGKSKVVSSSLGITYSLFNKNIYKTWLINGSSNKNLFILSGINSFNNRLFPETVNTYYSKHLDSLTTLFKNFNLKNNTNSGKPNPIINSIISYEPSIYINNNGGVYLGAKLRPYGGKFVEHNTTASDPRTSPKYNNFMGTFTKLNIEYVSNKDSSPLSNIITFYNLLYIYNKFFSVNNLRRISTKNYFNTYANIFLTNSAYNVGELSINKLVSHKKLKKLNLSLLLPIFKKINQNKESSRFFKKTNHNKTFKEPVSIITLKDSVIYNSFNKEKLFFNNKRVYTYLRYSNPPYNTNTKVGAGAVSRLNKNTFHTEYYRFKKQSHLKKLVRIVFSKKTKTPNYTKQKPLNKININKFYYFSLSNNKGKTKNLSSNLLKNLSNFKIKTNPKKWGGRYNKYSNTLLNDKCLLDSKLFFLKNDFNSKSFTGNNSHKVNNLFFYDQDYNPYLNQYKGVSKNGKQGNKKSSYSNNIFTDITLLQLTLNLKFFMFFLKNPFIVSTLPTKITKNPTSFFSKVLKTHSNNNKVFSNLTPSNKFSYVFLKKVFSSQSMSKLSKNFIPIYHNTLIRFIENMSGSSVIIQFYPFVDQSISKYFLIRYKLWLPRLTFYEKRLGHKFFLEESIHIMHLSFLLKDPLLILKWLKTIILRISFWKTRSIFRFIKYLMLNFYLHVFPTLGIKGFRVKLKGKISAAGNSRKRSILFRVGKTSHSTFNLNTLQEFDIITTFTGVMGLTVSIFY